MRLFNLLALLAVLAVAPVASAATGPNAATTPTPSCTSSATNQLSDTNRFTASFLADSAVAHVAAEPDKCYLVFIRIDADGNLTIVTEEIPCPEA